MKLKCYREKHSLDGVSVLSISEAEVPFSEVLEQKIADVTFQPAVEDAKVSDASCNRWIAPMPFCYRAGDHAEGEPVEAEGMLLGHGEGSLLSFLERRYVPDESSERSVDRLIGQFRRGEIGRSDWMRSMEEALVISDDRHRHVRMHYNGNTPLSPFFASRHSNIRGLVDERHDSLGSYFVRSFPRESPLAVVAPFEEEVEDVLLPRWRFAITAEYGDEVGGWDGRRYRVAERATDLPDSLVRTLERHGQVVLKPADWFLPLGDLQVDYLVRVPYPQEVAHLVEAGPPPWEMLRKPALLVDTRRPVPLKGRKLDVFVVDEPEAAVAVLCRQTARGGYIPQMPASPLEDLVLSTPDEIPRFLAGCWIQ